MELLRGLLENLGFSNISTYIQSGNMVFTAGKETTATAASRIAAGIKQQFGFSVPVLVLTADELKAVIAYNPFLMDNSEDTKMLHCTLLYGVPCADGVTEVNGITIGGDTCRIVGNTVYLQLHGGYGATKLNNAWLEKKLKVNATTRNWKTLLTLSEMAG